ncbi:cytochrome P450 [Armillaria gallica]|uniref:Cytochrome P450 n=1 Tax=Armillaria gallica TaxID=47427 RepID=A0A2H3DS38_ARMGA|nr:cytochrome P450 [Armillaria gallica]
MILYPDVQSQAQDKINCVVGRHHLPSFKDCEALPYISAICCEIVQWHSLAPLTGWATSKSDVYIGYEILQDTVVMVNLWAMSRDPDTFKDPDCFIPESFLKNGVLHDDVPDLMWGFGKRVCTGRVFAESTLWIAIACVLAAYNLTKDGHVRKQYTNSRLFMWAFITRVILLYKLKFSFRRPLPFKCSFCLRFPEVKVMILEEN